MAEWHSADDPNNREKINRARQAAEQLFKRMPSSSARDLPASTGNIAEPAEQERRQPRIFAMPPRVPVAAEPNVLPAPKPAPRPPVARRRSAGVAPAQFGRIRALTTYGMTREQVAELYGVTADEIARVLNYPLGSGKAR